MPSRANRPCAAPRCPNLTQERYCDEHQEMVKQHDQQRGTAHQRGYTWKWSKYSKRYLKHPDNVLCRLKLEGCTTLAECVDHIVAVNGPNDPLFWDKTNHQAACIKCNSAKGRKTIRGTQKDLI